MTKITFTEFQRRVLKAPFDRLSEAERIFNQEKENVSNLCALIIEGSGDDNLSKNFVVSVDKLSMVEVEKAGDNALAG